MKTFRGFGLDLMDNMQNEGTVHLGLMQSIEKITKRNLIAYVGFLRHPAGTIMDEDVTYLETLLKSIDLNKYDKNLDLIIHSPGGSPIAAEKLILTCRSYSNSFRVIVPKTAMSAATLIAMGADKIVMSDTSELGPIDPQMIFGARGQEQMRPAIAFIDAYTGLINKCQEAILAKKPPHPYLELLRKLDPSWIQICLKARDTSRKIAKDYLQQNMLKEKTEEEINKTIENFIKEGEESTHGRVIRAQKVKEFGLDVDIIDKEGDLWKLIWELYMRCEHYVQQRIFAKYLVCRNGAINIRVDVRRP